MVPDALLEQLKDGGRIAALFMDDGVGTAKVGYKIDGKMTWRALFNAAAPVLDGFARPQGFTL
jgi:protein-L-isoaspartate(D-aspartate) O-methyltransferase